MVKKSIITFSRSLPTLVLAMLMGFLAPLVSADGPSTTETTEANGSSYIRFEFPGIIAKSTDTGVLTLQHPGGSTEQQVASVTGQPLQENFQVPYQDGNYQVSYQIGDTVVLEADMAFQHDASTGLTHQLLTIHGDPALLHFPPEQHGIRITIGFVVGKITSQTNTRVAETCTIKIGVDLDGDDIVDRSEITEKVVSGTELRAETPEYLSLPLVAKYLSETWCGDAMVASQHGIYNFVQGGPERIAPEKSRHPDVVTGSYVWFSRLPKIASVAIPNTVFSPPQMVDVPFEQTEPLVTLDFTGDGSASVLESSGGMETGETGEAEPITNDTNTASQKSLSFDPSRVLESAWVPIGLVLGVVFLGFLAVKGARRN